MAKGKKTGGKNFEPGNKLSPGRPPLPEDIKEARKLNQFELERIMNKYLWLDRLLVQKAITDPTTPMMELMVASIVAQAAQKGDQVRLDFILSRLIGKVVDRVELQVEPLTIHRSNGEEVVLTSKPKKESSS